MTNEICLIRTIKQSSAGINIQEIKNFRAVLIPLIWWLKVKAHIKEVSNQNGLVWAIYGNIVPILALAGWSISRKVWVLIALDTMCTLIRFEFTAHIVRYATQHYSSNLLGDLGDVLHKKVPLDVVVDVSQTLEVQQGSVNQESYGAILESWIDLPIESLNFYSSLVAIFALSQVWDGLILVNERAVQSLEIIEVSLWDILVS